MARDKFERNKPHINIGTIGQVDRVAVIAAVKVVLP